MSSMPESFNAKHDHEIKPNNCNHFSKHIQTCMYKVWYTIYWMTMYFQKVSTLFQVPNGVRNLGWKFYLFTRGHVIVIILVLVFFTVCSLWKALIPELSLAGVLGVLFTLFQPEGADYAHHITASTPGFEDLKVS